MAPIVPPALAWLQALHQPSLVLSWSIHDWQRVTRLARRLRLLGRLAERLDDPALDRQLPDAVRRHLLAERRQSRWRLRIVSWTLEQLTLQLGPQDHPRVLLKGAAYLAQDLPVAAGRLPSDIDILVPRTALADTQARLQNADWAEAEMDLHDQRYYREWSHEVAPMRHADFGMELDLHHGILPPVASTTVDPELLLRRLQPSGMPGWKVFCPVDQVLHCAAHLFFDSELRDRLRDLVDLDGLLRHFSQHPEFWLDLTDRAGELGLVEPLALTFHYTTRWLGTPIPDPVRRRLQPRVPGPARQAWLLPLLDRVLWPTEPDEHPARSQQLAATALLARYHWGRLPLHLLLPHLWRKARSRRVGESESDDRF